MPDDLQPLNAVRFSALLERLERRKLLIGVGDDELADAAIRHAMRFAELVRASGCRARNAWLLSDPG